MKGVLEILEQNAGATPAQIAAMVGRLVTEVEGMIKQAEVRVSGIIDAISGQTTHE